MAISGRPVPTHNNYSKAVQWDIPATRKITGDTMFLDKDSRRMLKKQSNIKVGSKFKCWLGQVLLNDDFEQHRLQSADCDWWTVEPGVYKAPKNSGTTSIFWSARKVTRSKFHIKDLQILGVIMHNLVATVTCRPGFVHPYCTGCDSGYGHF